MAEKEEKIVFVVEMRDDINGFNRVDYELFSKIEDAQKYLIKEKDKFLASNTMEDMIVMANDTLFFNAWDRAKGTIQEIRIRRKALDFFK